MVPIFFVNLDARPERRAFMERQFEQFGITAERLGATVMDEVPPEVVARITRPGHLWRINPGDLACGFSHQRIWQIMVERDLAEALILEDDAVLTEEVRAYLAPGLLAQHGAGLIRLESRRQRVALGPVLADPQGLKLRELGSTHKGTAAYLISRKTAELSLNHPLVNDMAVDRFLFGHGGPHLYRTRILQADPAPVVQLDRLETDRPEAQSDIVAYRSKTRSDRRPRRRALGDIIRLELPLVGPRLSQRLRVPLMLGPRRPVAFVAD